MHDLATINALNEERAKRMMEKNRFIELVSKTIREHAGLSDFDPVEDEAEAIYNALKKKDSLHEISSSFVLYAYGSM